MGGALQAAAFRHLSGSASFSFLSSFLSPERHPTEGLVPEKLRKEKSMQLEIIILGEVSQKEKNQYHMISLICGI